MKRIIALLSAVLLLVTAGVCAGESERPDPATPTDLACTHEHVKDVYFYDKPSYVRINDQYHKVVGFNVLVQTVCEDCGEVLSSDVLPEAEECRSHAFKNGRCVLCGCPEPEIKPAAEQIAVPRSEAPDETLLVLTVTAEELAVLEAQGVETLVIRPDGYPAAIALPVRSLREELEAESTVLRAEMDRGEDGAVFAALRLQGTGEGIPRTEGIQLRFYLDMAEETVSFRPENPEASALEETAVLEDDPDPLLSFWFVPWLGNGTYNP